MKRAWIPLAAALLAIAMAGSASAVDLIGFYEFEGNFNNTTGPIGAATPLQNPGQVSFAPGGFRGQAVDINDPAMSGGGNTGGTVDIPFNVSPAAWPNANGPGLDSVSFGGWFNLQSNAGFPGAVAADNGGWDRGIHLNGNNWGIASGGSLNNVAGASTNQWTYVMGTFDKASNLATLYVGDDVAATQTTTVGSRPDGQNSAGTLTLEIGRYDNQDLDALVDDFTVWNEALTADEANAIRNLRLNPTLDYSPADAELLFDLFDAGSGSVMIGDTEWTIGNVQAGSPGQLFDLGGGDFGLLLNSGLSANNGLIGSAAAVPEPSTIAIWTLLGFAALAYGWRRKTQAK